MGPAPEQAHLRDFAMPQRGVFVVGRGVFVVGRGVFVVGRAFFA